jgi:hypothetical protein
MTKQDYINLLKDNILLVKFTKKDGSVRELKCTLKPNIINEYYENNSKPTATRTTPEHQVCAIDVELNEFRSFTISSVIDYKVL